MDARFERVRTNRPAATSIKRVTAICETIRIRARLRPRNPYPRDSPVRDSLSAGIKSILVDWSAGASPNSIPVNSDSPRSEERRVGKECRTRWSAEHEKKKKQKERPVTVDEK